MRQVVTKKKYEMVPVFGGEPLRFSLVDFGEVTGLPCGEFEDGGDDTVTLLNYPEKTLPQHVGLNLATVRKAEHDPGLLVKPMMDISGSQEDGWGVWDDEELDKLIEYICC
ncbi:hypothetical protein Bca4012_045136 [Brassica carinata]|uniref:DUF1985 domain-containing protein n=1 Tax=Brassica carinata TaxID=52824 RepID=A0A8X7QUM7_BRACI|nr:hypothetical protein Bca52824_057410 [Brassica carinata]